MGKTREKRKATKFEAISMLVLMFAVFAVGTKLGLNYVPLMICVAAYSIFIAWRCGYSWKEQEKAINARIGKAVPVLSIFLGVGMLVGSFMFSGTIPMLIYYGIQIVSAKWIYLCAFLLCAIFSILTGTANGSVSTSGLAMMSIGLAMDGVNLGLLAGAILCGATIGDKLSPLSDTTIMASAVTDNDVMDHIKHQAKVVIPAALITLVIYIIIGFTTHTDASA
ncbi:MAG: Na+/H+ antiporter NhaC, partial [Oscillospiraceae bacterium]|nr:Na+/H+ antiporter NhaC [Oscillospiraceae bacterium]